MKQEVLLAINDIALKYVDLPNLGHKDVVEAKSNIKQVGASGPMCDLALSLIMSFRSRERTKTAEFDGILKGLHLGAELEERRSAPQVNVQNFQESHHMRDKFENSGQAGAMGPQAHAHDMQFVQQIWNQMGVRADPALLADELGKILEAMKPDAAEPEHFDAMGAVSRAKRAADSGDGPGALANLKTAGKWALDVATKIGTAVATEAMKKSMGL
jgi:hypothetical protein